MLNRICIDQDQVVADIIYEWLRRYNYDYNDNLQREDLTDWNWHHITKPEAQEKIYTYLDDPELFENLPVIEGSQDVIYKLSKEYEIFFVTAPFNSNNIVPKEKWLQRHFEFISDDNFVFTKNKSIVNTGWLIDDKAKNFIGVSGKALLYSAPHNQNETRYERMKNWNDVAQYFGV